MSNAIAAGSLRLVFEALTMLSMGGPFDVENASHPSSGIANQEIGRGIAHSSQCMPHRADQTDEQRAAHADAIRKGLANMTDEQKAAHSAALSVATSKVWADRTDQQKADHARRNSRGAGQQDRPAESRSCKTQFARGWPL